MARRTKYVLRYDHGTIDLVCTTCDLPLQAWLVDDEPVVLDDALSVARAHDDAEHR